MPFNMNTFNKIWGVFTPEEAKQKIEEEKKEANITEPKLAQNDNKVIFGGRLGQYKYYDMDKVIAAALECVKINL